MLARWRADPRVWRNVVLEEQLPGRAADPAPAPADLHPAVKRALLARGISTLYSHQLEAFNQAKAGRDLVVSTPTASGKSLCFHLPVLDALAAQPNARALYLFPTKALSRDQEQSVRRFLKDAELDHGAVTYDGDTPQDARRAARERSGVLLTNPDMLHSGILPHHANWARFFADLRFVVLDELHTYRGIFGSHLTNVLRRLDRVARFHGSQPVYLFASATIGNPQEHASRMLGRDVALIARNGSPAGPRRVLVYNPPVVNSELGIRASYVKATTALAADLVRGGVSTLVFAQSRNTVEVILKYLRESLADDGSIGWESVQGYRSGYLPNTRRTIESSLREGRVKCVVATSALELGIDVGSLDAVICAAYPGSLAGLWQRFGRAGRRLEESLAVLVASSGPMDQYIAGQPQLLLNGEVEQARIDPDNIQILIQHIKCASFELPFEEGETFRDLPAEGTKDSLEFLTQNEVLHATVGASGRRVFHWSTDAYPASHVSLRSAGWDNIVIIDQAKNTLAEMDWPSAHTLLHDQAIYQQDGEQYQVERLDLANRKAFVRKVQPDYFTTAMVNTRVSPVAVDRTQSLAEDAALRLEVSLGDVSVISKITGFKKIKFYTHENVGYGEVALPDMQMHTSALWAAFPESLAADLSLPRPLYIEALRGVGHALRTVACLGLMTDPRDIGMAVGVAEDGPRPKSSGEGFDPTLYLYDNVPEGAGFAARLFEERHPLFLRARSLVERCRCRLGCPGCIGIMGTREVAGQTPLKDSAISILDRCTSKPMI